MRVELTAKAESDLRDIALFIAADSPARAMTFYGELRAVCLELAKFPRRYQVVRSLEGIEIRRRVYRNYVMLYRLYETRIVVLRVVRGSMDLDALFDEPGLET
ncbi:type II toxin-antitoxin system RelE/ParE family toxin [Chelativorans sp.]|uniref:type II toxin-antitoxin system RelE/ParE family toxin n=1 Tax=Chelativorans sp. TaxID=2203393 RepID=UPI002810E992|nr:type II toxin-antitoxin system RelE/ParE family toxin [Chelativorans sp.]